MDLKKLSGLPIEINESMELVFPHTVMVMEVTERTAEEMLPFLQSKKATTAKNPIYSVYHEIACLADADKIRQSGLRYDLTAIQAGTFEIQPGENEFLKTAGHYHPSIRGVDYPEIYEVLEGKGRWIIQRYKTDPASIEEAYLIEAGPGEKICIPPRFGHVTINTEPEHLIIGNVIGESVGHDYDPFQKLKGACYRLLATRQYNMIEIERNSHYQQIPDLVKLKPKKDWFKGYGDPLYSLVAHSPDMLAFLAKPETYNPEFFSIQHLYQEIKSR